MRAVLLAAALLAACTTVPPPPVGGWSGKLGYRVDASSTQRAQAGSALFELQGDARAGRMLLSTPLGTGVAEAQWSGALVRLHDGQAWREYPSLAALGEALGEALQGPPLPLHALFDWLQGRPLAAEPFEPGPDGSFMQAGWRVLRVGDTQLRIERSRSDGGRLLLTLVLNPS